MQPTASKSRRLSLWRGLQYILAIALVAGAFFALFHRNDLYDAYKLHGYTAPAPVVQLAAETTMTPYAKHLFYVNQPDQQQRSTFSKYCPSGTEQTVVLGCYKAGERGIYLLKVDNSELSGIEQVTAAHEMLHAAYERLSSKDRSNVDTMLQSYYDSGKLDPTIKTVIDSYRQSEPKDVVNEMHSIFGTEVADLPAGLQQYYTRYFSDRAVVTGDYQRYEAAFTTRQAQLKAYDKQLDSLKKQIDSLTSSVESQQAQLKSSRSSVDPGNQQQVSNYNRQVDSYNSQVRQLRVLTDQYNSIVASRNSIALEEQQLVQSISSSPVQEQ